MTQYILARKLYDYLLQVVCHSRSGALMLASPAPSPRPDSHIPHTLSSFFLNHVLSSISSCFLFLPSATFVVGCVATMSVKSMFSTIFVHSKWQRQKCTADRLLKLEWRTQFPHMIKLIKKKTVFSFCICFLFWIRCFSWLAATRVSRIPNAKRNMENSSCIRRWNVHMRHLRSIYTEHILVFRLRNNANEARTTENMATKIVWINDNALKSVLRMQESFWRYLFYLLRAFRARFHYLLLGIRHCNRVSNVSWERWHFPLNKTATNFE